MSDAPPCTLRLILVPSIVTLLVSVARLVGELQGWVTDQSGGAAHVLGITWLVFVFGAWFGWQLLRRGAGPRQSRPFLTMLVLAMAMAGTGIWQFSGIDRQAVDDTAYQALRAAVVVIVGVSLAAMLLTFTVWGRLAWTLLCYGLLARGTVVAIAWLAHTNGWHTHHVKFGPAGIEREIGDTMLSACISQFGFWVPFTVVFGTLVGSLFARGADETT
jgi:hypothetical protein